MNAGCQALVLSLQPACPCAGFIAAVYAELRELECAQQVPHSYTTARTLLSILRLAQALARLRFEAAVDQVGMPHHKARCWPVLHAAQDSKLGLVTL